MKIRKVDIHNFRNFNKLSAVFTDEFQTIIGENNIGKSNFLWALRLVLDKNLSFNNRSLMSEDFHDFPEIDRQSYISISIVISSSNFELLPNLHGLRISDTECRLTFFFSHNDRYGEFEEEPVVSINDFNWKLLGGGKEFDIDGLKYLNEVHLKNLHGINLYYISGFRNINQDIFGSNRSLLSQYIKSRKSHDNEKGDALKVLAKANEDLNNLDFIPDVVSNVIDKNKEISGQYFSFPIGISFGDQNKDDPWSQLEMNWTSHNGKSISSKSLGLGQKNLLYLSLFMARLENRDDDEFNIVLIEEPEAHLHPQLQKILFAKLSNTKNTQAIMTSHSTHIASDHGYKNLNVFYRNIKNDILSFSPFSIIPDNKKDIRDQELLKRYLDATRSELFFSSGVIFVEGVGEQFIIPSIAKKCYNVNLGEYNISIIPIHSRYFDPFLKLFQDGQFEIHTAVIIDGDSKEMTDDGEVNSIQQAKQFEVEGRVIIFPGTETLEIDLFPNREVNIKYLEECFQNLGHAKSFQNLMNSDPSNWNEELIRRVDKTIMKGRFAQELSLLIDEDFEVPGYIKGAIEFVCQSITGNEV